MDDEDRLFVMARLGRTRACDAAWHVLRPRATAEFLNERRGCSSTGVPEVVVLIRPLFSKFIDEDGVRGSVDVGGL